MKADLLTICGSKHTGKTTLIERLLPFFIAQGLRVGVIKHDGHTYAPDVPGTDSDRYFQANAEAVAVYDGEKSTVTRRGAPSAVDLIAAFSDMDLILIEGLKQSDYPKIEIVRAAVSTNIVSNSENRLAFVSECMTDADVPVFHPDDAAGIAAFILAAYRAGKLQIDPREDVADEAGSGETI